MNTALSPQDREAPDEQLAMRLRTMKGRGLKLKEAEDLSLKARGLV